MALHKTPPAQPGLPINPLFARLDSVQAVPVDRLTDAGSLPDTAKEFVADQLMLDGNSRLNLATFVSTWMEPEARELMAMTLDKNIIDKDEYPRTAAIEQRCVSILANLWNAPDGEHVGTSCTGSSEACMLAGLALKWRWRDRQGSAGKPSDRPNLVMGSNVQVVWEKFCRYFDVEMRLVDVDDSTWHLMPGTAVKACDENTIGVVAVLGSTYDGSYEPVADIAAALDEYEKTSGNYVPVHVDAASGGFIAPFLDQELEWDFRIERVVSINSSGHKYGLVYPGVGWAIWRSEEHLHPDLVFHVAYLGGDMPTFALNFSRPGSQIVAQYYNFVRLGFDGYARVQQGCRDVALHLSRQLGEMGVFEVIADGSELPVVCVKLKDDIDNYSVYDISERLRIHGWLVPAYPMPPAVEETHVLRFVIRNGFSLELSDMLLENIAGEVDVLKQREAKVDTTAKAGFHH